MRDKLPCFKDVLKLYMKCNIINAEIMEYKKICIYYNRLKWKKNLSTYRKCKHHKVENKSLWYTCLHYVHQQECWVFRE